MANTFVAIGATAALVAFSTVALAEDRFSLRAGAALAEPAGGDLEDDLGFLAGASWHFLPWLSAEVGYNDFGSFKSKEQLEGSAIRVSGDSFEIGLAAHLDLGDSGIYGQARLGGHRWDMTAKEATFALRDDGTDLYYGAGVGYRFDSGLGVLLAYDRYEVGDGDLNRVSLSIEIRL